MAKEKATEKTGKVLDELSEGTKPASALLAWEAPAFAYYEKSQRWLIAVIVIGLILAGFFLWTRNYSALAVVLVGSWVVVDQGRRKPDTVKYSVDEQGFHIGERLLSWSQLKSFWLVNSNEHPHLYLETTERWLNLETVYLANIEPAELRSRLAQKLPERTTDGEQLAERLSRWLRL